MRIRNRFDSPIQVFHNLDIDEDDREKEPPVPAKPEIGSSSSETITLTVTAADFRSVCKPAAARKLASEFNVPREYGLRAPTPGQRADAPPPGYAAVYTKNFRYGLRLPLQPFVVSVLGHYRIALSQLHPNGVYTILRFVEKCEGINAVPTIGLFRHFFRLKKTGTGTAGWYTLIQRERRIFPAPISRVGGWKRSFLFFKTEPFAGNLVWNPSPIMNPAYDEPSEQTVRMLEASADEDISMASLPEMGITKVQTNPSSTKKEPTSAESKNATNNPNTGSAELPKKKLKRMAEVYTTEPTKAFKGLTGEKLFDGSSVSSQLHSVPELKDTTSEQFAHFIQKSVRSFTEEQEKVLEAISLLHGDKKELEKENALLKAEVVQLREKDNEIGLLHEEKKELEKENASLKTEIFKLQDKENEIVLLQEGKMKLQKENDLLKTRVSQLQDRENEDKKELRIKNDLLKLNVSRLQDRGYETAQLQGYNKELQIKNDLLTSKVSWLEYQNYEITQLRGYKEKLQTENYTSQVSWLQDREQEFQAENDMLKSKVSRLQVVSDDRGQLLKVYTWKLLKTRAFAKFFEDLKTSAKKVGRHEAVEKMQIRYPDLKPKAFIGLEDPLAESKLDDQFFSMIQDDGFEIPLLNHLLSVEEVPNSSELKHLDEDEDRNALIRKNPTSTK